MVYRFQCGLCNEFNCRECVSYFAIKSAEQTGISPLSNKAELTEIIALSAMIC